MAVLNSSQRNTLEKAVLAARRASEQGAVNALKAFAVHHHEPYAHMSGEERALRNHLRSKARLLGDHTTHDGGHTINKLAYELAYEYWHRMLFARFLEANDLLIHPEHQMAVSLEECEELADEEGHDDKWVAAAYYASKMLPAIFRQDDPLMEIKFATEDRIKLEQILEGIGEEIYQSDDSLGWVYQYWQSEAKETINASGDKIDGEKLPAVTQLFTEPYMVHFLIDNTLGAWWTARNPGITPPIEFKYLRTLDDGTPAAGNFDGWPTEWKDITMMDPSMGSGHFVVEVFKVMATLRKRDEALSNEEACDAVIRENIHGLELDDRCTQIAAFNLALSAWKFCGHYRELPEMNLACCGIAPKGKKEDWVKLANAEQDPAVRARLKGGLERMYDLFQKAPELGSLIDPTAIQRDAFTSDFTEIEPFLEKALATETSNDEDLDRGIIAVGIAKAGRLLAKGYVWQITNVPYLGRGRQPEDGILRTFCETYYPKSKHELATTFIERIMKNGTTKTISVVTPQNWLFQPRYKAFRKMTLHQYDWSYLAWLGSGAFSQITGEVVKAILVSLSNWESNDYFFGIDASDKDYELKPVGLKNDPLINLSNEDQLKNPDFIISKVSHDKVDVLNDFAISIEGISTGDNERFVRKYYEFDSLLGHLDWEYFIQHVTENELYGGRSDLILWEEGKGVLRNYPSAHNFPSEVMKGVRVLGANGLRVTQMTDPKCTLYTGEIFGKSGATIVPINDEYLIPMFCYCNSEEFTKNINNINQSLYRPVGTFLKVPFDYDYWRNIANEKFPAGLPKPYSDDPTQWLFHGHPKCTDSPLQVTISRLLGYQWPAEYDEEMEMADEAREKIQAIHDLALPFDEDGIVCIPPVNGESAAADRIREQIMKVWGDDYNGNTTKSLLQQEGSKKKDLESYLRDDFFGDHCKLFKNRPFIWHIWDGRKDGFSALVNYHKLDKANLEKLIFTYLGDWIRQCELKLQNGVSGTDGLLSAAKQLKEKLLLILKGEPPYDLFIRWKPIEEQPIGWDPDINDGVRLNVYPFVEAGVLRRKFNVKWKKDRGKNPSGSPWGPLRYNRYEDLDEDWKLKDDNGKVIPHLTTEMKRQARESKKTDV